MKNDRAVYLILGNSTAAVGAIEGIRKIDPDGRIVLVSQEPYHTYSRPLISYYLAGEVQEDAMYFRGPGFYDENGVEARLGVRAISLDVARRIVTTSDGEKVPFSRLLIATGGTPFIPPLEGAGCDGIFTFTSWDDAKAVASYVDQEKPARALVIGGGLIGIKVSEALVTRGLEIHLVECADGILPGALDEKGSAYALDAMREAGVGADCGTRVEKITSGNGNVSGAVLSTGRVIPCELVIVAAGVVPGLSLVENSPIKIDVGILTNDRGETSVEGVYAAGDVTQVKDTLSGSSRPIPTFPNAYRQGLVAGTNMAGGNAVVNSAFSMNSIEVFGLPAISIGLANVSGSEYEIMERCDDASRIYRRIVLKNQLIAGALFVGNIERAGIVTGLIRERIDVSPFRELLLTDQFGLISLPTEYRKHFVTGDGIEV
jgi:NAD(P)H-nitrite reductase large subunit